MSSETPWRRLEAFADRNVPKLDNLRRAARAGLAVPTTVWAPAVLLAAHPDVEPPRAIRGLPCIVRSGSPSEDTATTSNAGRFLSLPVHDPAGFREAVARVVAVLPKSDGQPQGVVFVQPLIRGEAAGVTFFDGFYFEESWENGGNVAS